MAPTVLLEYTAQKETKKCSQKVLVTMMGKTQRVSKGHSSGFVPDYRHALETMGESAGFGSSGRVDAEMTASEDSCVRKRKCISLNVDKCDGFGVPLQFLSVAKLSQSKRKDLELRLKVELEQVRILQKKVALRSTNGITLSSCSDIHSCSGRQQRPPLENFQRSTELSHGHGKKRVPVGRNEPIMKQNLSGKFQSMKQVVPLSTSDAILMKQCERLLKNLMSHQFGWVFNTPVDVVKLNIPDYFTVIKHPMDLGTVKSKIASGAYSSPLCFVADVRLTFSNAMTYNPQGNDVHHMADALGKYFEVRWKSIEKKLPVIDAHLVPAKSGVPREMKAAKPMPPSKKSKITMSDHKVNPEPVKRIMTDEWKHKLSRELELLGEIPEHIVDFIRRHSFNESQTGEDEIEIDIDALTDDTLFTIRKLLDDYLQEKQTKLKKAEPCEMEILNESGPSNSSMQPCKANDAVEEDVDIGGNDPPVSSYPPVEIEKDTANRSSKCSSLNSSSSESGSSSSEFFTLGWLPCSKSREAEEVVSAPDLSGVMNQSLSKEPLEIKKASVFQGEPAPHFSADVIERPSPLKFAVIAKCAYGRPSIADLKISIKKQIHTRLEFSVGIMDSRHFLLRFEVESDFLAVWLKEFCNIEGKRGAKEKMQHKGKESTLSWVVKSFSKDTSLPKSDSPEFCKRDEATITVVVIEGEETVVTNKDEAEYISVSKITEDSDSGSSSGSKLISAKASILVNTLKVQETGGSGADLDQKRSGLSDPLDINQSFSGLDQLELNSQPKTISVEADSCQEGGSGPFERQVSPDKLYRVALLRRRFADTILKAREKALDKGEKGDPEKLRREREELERQQREEKARLQAEAKAAEDARRLAEAEAAAEAKRKRDLEREAARQALLKMEKTVEINENCRLFEDLEMLGAAPVEPLLGSVDEMSPDHSLDGMGSFNLRGISNPLEQLGLYMKVDDEEEEECEPHSVPDPVNDVEEGEID
ncbi:hypothetical protein HHK36_015769 [Tetracentron sinense]|uniref:Uncharacterized protein n=1 Tax=Tetracentron sinense TaxID=13715 RepID=A0A834Z2U6_TETSI|nr:hypothetical protein HHK36_015769 [Tetracentron sinense]